MFRVPQQPPQCSHHASSPRNAAIMRQNSNNLMDPPPPSGPCILGLVTVTAERVLLAPPCRPAQTIVSCLGDFAEVLLRLLLRLVQTLSRSILHRCMLLHPSNAWRAAGLRCAHVHRPAAAARNAAIMVDSGHCRHRPPRRQVLRHGGPSVGSREDCLETGRQIHFNNLVRGADDAAV